MKDIGTLGGPDTFISWQNGDGQIVGSSYTSYTPDPANYGAGALGGFLWQHGKMINLGNLGGTVTNASWINDRGEIVGQSNLAGDKMTRPFLWVNGRMTNLGSLGGSYAQARYILPRRETSLVSLRCPATSILMPFCGATAGRSRCRESVARPMPSG